METGHEPMVVRVNTAVCRAFRRWAQSAARLLLVAVTALALVAGTNNAAESAAGRPQSGGTLTVVLNSPPAGLDPHRSSSISTIYPMSQIYNGLVRMDPDGTAKVVPDLASSWTVSKDNRTLTFELTSRKVTWQDGQPFSMDDVLASLHHMGTSPAGRVATMSGTFNNVASYKALDERHLQIVLKEPDPDFLFEMAQGYAAIEPKHIIDVDGDMSQKAIGTGPYKVEEYRPGSFIKLVRNPSYNVSAQKPYLDGITFTVIPDRGSYLSALATGRADTMGVSGPEKLTDSEAAELKAKNPGIQLLQDPKPNSVAMYMNSKVAPFDDVRVREAAFLALNRGAALKVFYPKSGVLPGLMPPDWGLSQRDLGALPGYREPHDQDVKKARQLLSDAGHANGLPIQIMSRTQSTTLDPAQMIAQQLKDAGFNPTIVPTPDANFWTNGSGGKFQAMVFTPNNALPASSMARFLEPGGDLSFSQINDPDDLALWQAEKTSATQAERIQALRKIERLWLTKIYAAAPLVEYSGFTAASGKVHGLKLSPMQVAGFSLDHVWLSQ